MLLAIDTSAGTSVAVVDGDRVLSDASDPGTRGHAALIGTLIQRALADAEASPAATSRTDTQPYGHYRSRTTKITRVSFDGTNGRAPALPLGSETVRIIRDLVGTRRLAGPLLVQRGGSRMTDNAVRAVLLRLSERTGVERVSPHDFRHTASTNYSANGADEALKYKVFGWNPDARSMNQRYTHRGRPPTWPRRRLGSRASQHRCGDQRGDRPLEDRGP